MSAQHIQKQVLNPESAEKQTSDPKYRRSNPHFEKNYPKNIFIPIIEYLNEVGLKQKYETIVGTREQLENKNVVSLAVFHELLSQNWFQGHVDLEQLQKNICNKIFLNSKIKKKLFHLKVTSLLLQVDEYDSKKYKKFVSKNANTIAQSIQEDDQVFKYSSSLVYLLRIFHECLKRIQVAEHKRNQVCFDKMFPLDRNQLEFDSKQQMKFLCKQILELLQKVKIVQNYEQILQKIQEIFEFRSKQICQKYILAPQTPNWLDFYDCFVHKCFTYKFQGVKITHSSLKAWLRQYKQKTANIGISIKKNMTFEPIVIIYPPHY